MHRNLCVINRCVVQLKCEKGTYHYLKGERSPPSGHVQPLLLAIHPLPAGNHTLLGFVGFEMTVVEMSYSRKCDQ